MITTAEQYNSYLHVIDNANPPVYAALPTADNIYNIDIKTREIDSPQFLAVERDNISETIYFIVDRYVDYMDLALTSCIITYKNAKGITRLYSVPFYDIYTYAHAGKIIIPWNLEAGVTEVPGVVEFAIQFLVVKEVFNPETKQKDKQIVYNLNTQIAKSMVLPGIDIKDLGEDYNLSLSDFEQLSLKITALEKLMKETHLPYWKFLKD